MRSSNLWPLLSGTVSLRRGALASALVLTAGTAGIGGANTGSAEWVDPLAAQTGTVAPARWIDPVTGASNHHLTPGSPVRQGPTFAGRIPLTPGSGPLPPIAELPIALFESVAFGDTDHDAKNEIILYNGSNGDFHFRVLEDQGDDTYTEEYAGPSLIPYAVSDLDGDGLSEVIGQDGNWIYVYESPDVSSHPTLLAWRSPLLENIVGYTAVGDTDRDGKMEIIHSRNPWEGDSALLIYESTGNNSFSLVLEAPTGRGDKGRKAIGDFDQDGLIEIVFCGLEGDLHVFESSADDTWTETFTLETGVYNAFWCIGGEDTDGNGKPEFFLQGSRIQGWTTYVFEASGNDTYEIVDTLVEDDGYVGLSSCALAQLELGGPTYYITDIAEHLSIYEPIGPGNWEKVYEQPDPNGTWHHGVFSHDVNQNGRDELVWTTGGNFATLVLESPNDPSDIGGQSGSNGSGLADAQGRLGSLRVAPNPVTGTATLENVATILEQRQVRTDRLRLELLDASGRRIRSERFDPDVPRWNAGSLPTGRYMLRLSAEHGPIAAGPVTIVR
ncbi:MAG: VCBS repeat-containing protein [Candidatus Eisenbacteria bacterium]